jgi:uncharacterized protein YbdZ (MbtH family)
VTNPFDDENDLFLTCVNHVEEHWKDMRPASMVRAMSEAPSR